MDDDLTLEISGTTSVQARELRDFLLDSVQGLKISVRKPDSRAQDFGSTLVLVLGTPAVVILAQAVRDFVKRKKIRIKIQKPNGESIEGENLSASDFKRLLSSQG